MKGEMEKVKDVRRKLLALMKVHQLDTKGFSDKCGIEEGRIDVILRSRARLTMSEAEKIAEAFGQTVEETFSIEPLPVEEAREFGKTEFQQMITERLNTIAKLKKVDAAGFAEKCGLKKARTANLLKGDAVITVMEAVKVADAFNVSLDYIMGFYPYPFPTPKDDKEARLFEQIGRMSLDELAEFSDILKEKMNDGIS